MSDESFINVGNVWATINGPLRAKVAQMLTYRKPGFQFTTPYKQGRWDGWIHVVNMSTGRFPAGLVPHVVAKLGAEGTRLPIADVRDTLDHDYLVDPSKITTNVELLPYQAEAIEKALKAERGVIHHPVGSGKTVVLIELVRRVGYKALVLVHRKDLLHQTYRRFKETWPGANGIIGMCGDGRWAPHAVTVATFQTIYRKLHDYPKEVEPWLQEIGQVHVDEVQHLPADTFGKVMARIPNARHRFGYSATPFKSEGDNEAYIRVVGWTGPVIHALPPKEGVEFGRLVPADIFLLPAGGPPPDDDNWPRAYASGITYNEVRNMTIVRLAHVLQKVGPTLILVERLAHGKILSEALRCPFLSGQDASDLRNKTWEAMRQDKLPCLVASRIADEGLDIPNIRHLFIAGGGKAGHLLIQRVGRGMRRIPGKDRLTVIDFMDAGKYVGRHSLARRRTYQKGEAYSVIQTTVEEIFS